MVKQETIVVVVNTILVTIVSIYTLLVLISSTINNSRIKSINLNYNINSLRVKGLQQQSSSTTTYSGIKKGIKKAAAVASVITATTTTSVTTSSLQLLSPASRKQALTKSAKGKQAPQRLRRPQAARTITFAIPITPTHKKLSPIPSFGVALSLRLTLPRAQRGVRIIYRRSNLRSKRLNPEDINNPTTTA
jgi:hypothetical protein